MAEQARLHEKHGGVAVAQHVVELGRLEPGVQGDEHAARQRHAEGGRHPLGPVAHEQGDARALGQPARQQAAGDPPSLFFEPPVPPAENGAVGLVEADRLSLEVARRRLCEETAEGQGADPLLGVGRRSPERGHVYSGSCTSTGPLAITAPSWLVITRSIVTTGAPSMGSSRTSVTVASRTDTSPSKGGKRYCTFEWRT